MKIEFERMSNVRDLGGMAGAGGRTVVCGRLYRADQPHFATPADIEQLAGLGLGLLADFRSEPEVRQKPDPQVPGVPYEHIPILKKVTEGITRVRQADKRIVQRFEEGERITLDEVNDHMCSMYRGFVSDPYCAGQYRRFVQLAVAQLREGRAVMWHCTAGKDRTGFAAAVLLSVLGVSREDMVADYLESNANLAKDVEGIMQWLSEKIPDEGSAEAALHYFTADAGYLKAAFDEADARYGGFDGYLEEALGLGPAQRDELRELLLA